MKPLVYVAGPYRLPDPVENTHNAIQVGVLLRDTFDVAPIVPHLTLLANMAVPRPELYWLDWDFDMLERCDAVVRIHGESKGADAEVAFAHGLRLPVFGWPEAALRLTAWRSAWSPT